MNTNVRSAADHSRLMGTANGSTAVTNAISRPGLEVIAMTSDAFRREKMYQSMMLIMRKMLGDGSITRKQYDEIDAKMLEKYKPIFGTLFSDPDLINAPKRVMNGSGKERENGEN